MNEQMHFTITEENCGDRLDSALSELMQEFSRSHIQRLIKEGTVLINGQAAKASRLVKSGDILLVTVPQPAEVEILSENIPLDIVYQDGCFAVINKQQGLTVHPANGVYTGTLVNALAFHLKDLSGINGAVRPGIVHRLDKDTSGLIVVAKNDIAHLSLARQISEKSCRRIYVALVEGVVKADEGVVEQPIGRSKSDRKKMDIVVDGRYAKTAFFVEKRFSNHTLVRFELFTGRTHQIRVHAKFLGHPVVGDKTYGFKHQRFNLDGQLLHSKKLSFTHPLTGELMEFDSELPEYFQRVLRILE